MEGGKGGTRSGDEIHAYLTVTVQVSAFETTKKEDTYNYKESTKKKHIYSHENGGKVRRYTLR